MDEPLTSSRRLPSDSSSPASEDEFFTRKKRRVSMFDQLEGYMSMFDQLEGYMSMFDQLEGYMSMFS